MYAMFYSARPPFLCCLSSQTESSLLLGLPSLYVFGQCLALRKASGIQIIIIIFNNSLYSENLIKNFS